MHRRESLKRSNSDLAFGLTLRARPPEACHALREKVDDLLTTGRVRDVYRVQFQRIRNVIRLRRTSPDSNPNGSQQTRQWQHRDPLERRQTARAFTT